MCEICSKLTIKTPERREWHRSGVFIVNFTYFTHCSDVHIVDFEQVNAGWVIICFKITPAFHTLHHKVSAAHESFQIKEIQ